MPRTHAKTNEGNRIHDLALFSALLAKQEDWAINASAMCLPSCSGAGNDLLMEDNPRSVSA